MGSIKLYESELKLMELLWSKEPLSAKQLSILATEQYGWNKNTTYTVIKKLIEKDMIIREEPGFICTSTIKKADIQLSETRSLIDKLFNGSKKAFLSAFMEDENITKEELDELKKMIENRR